MMTRQEQLAIAAMAAVAVGLILVYSGSGTAALSETQGAVDGVVWHWGYPQGHEHLAQPWEIGETLWGPHPLYCDPRGPGKYRDPLIARGWEWISDPPSEATL
jgi:hypothetical protein